MMSFPTHCAERFTINHECAGRRASPFVRGQRVRCYFGTEHRDGTVEHVAKSGAIHVRVSPGWVHIVHDAEDLQTLEFVPSTAAVPL